MPSSFFSSRDDHPPPPAAAREQSKPPIISSSRSAVVSGSTASPASSSSSSSASSASSSPIAKSQHSMGLSSDVTGLDWPLDIWRNGSAGNPQRQHWPLLVCPRCNSNDTKFCYYNNYSKSQPRHFCKTCRRHWTEGGTLRNVPVGGGGRKNKRQKTTTVNSFVANHDTGANTVNSTSSLPPQPQQKQTLPFGGGHGSDSIFPEILRQILLPPPELPLPSQYFGVSSSLTGSLPEADPPSPPPSQFASTKPEIMNSYGNIARPFSISTPCSSSPSFPYYVPILEEGHIASINVPMASTWQAPPPPPSVPVSDGGVGLAVPDPSFGYWSSWEDDMAGITTTTELKLPYSDKTQQP